MSSFFDNDATNKPRELDSVLRYTNPSDTPAFSMLKGGSDLQGTKYEVSVEKYQTGSHAPVHEGAPVTEGDVISQVPSVIPTLSQTFRRVAGVSNVAKVVRTGTEAKGAQLGKQIAVGMIAMKRGMEARFLSDQECAVQVGTSTTAMATRGAFKMIQSTAQATLPVPAAFRPAAAQNYSGTMANFTEAALKAMIAGLYKSTEGLAKSLDGFVGIDLQQHLDTFTDVMPVGAGYAAARQYAAGDVRTYVSAVKRLVLSGVEIDLHNTTRLLTDTAGNATAETHMSGIFLDFSMWSMEYNKAPYTEELGNDGGGTRVKCEAIGMFCCKNPLGSMSARISA